MQQGTAIEFYLIRPTNSFVTYRVAITKWDCQRFEQFNETHAYSLPCEIVDKRRYIEYLFNLF